VRCGMTKGLEIRAQIDAENAKGLLLINGGAAIALLAFLPAILDKTGYEVLTRGVLWALFALQFGLLLAVAHNSLRRTCSLEWERHGYKPPAWRFLRYEVVRPRVCWVSDAALWLSVAAFIAAGVSVFACGLYSLSRLGGVTPVCL
jgi:hypothetical protein